MNGVVNIIRKKGVKLDASHPTLLYAYGGYGISMIPNFLASDRVLLERGFVYAVANLRGVDVRIASASYLLPSALWGHAGQLSASDTTAPPGT